ncbi:hypothetical protein PMIN04_003590 [Paraphaeosphaeria minitans]
MAARFRGGDNAGDLNRYQRTRHRETTQSWHCGNCGMVAASMEKGGMGVPCVLENTWTRVLQWAADQAIDCGHCRAPCWVLGALCCSQRDSQTARDTEAGGDTGATVEMSMVGTVSAHSNARIK